MCDEILGEEVFESLPGGAAVHELVEGALQPAAATQLGDYRAPAEFACVLLRLRLRSNNTEKRRRLRNDLTCSLIRTFMTPGTEN